MTLTFLFLRLLPGGPFEQDVNLNPVVRQQLEKSWQLQAGIGTQYLSYMKALLKGDLGVSMLRSEQSVTQIITHGFKQTLLLNLISLVFIYLGAFLLASAAGYWREPRLKAGMESLLMALVSLPALFIAPFLIYIFGFYLNLLPVAFLTGPRHFILPVLALSLRPMASLARILQKSISEQWQADYVRAARARGAGRARLLFLHILRNSLNPLLSYSGPLVVSLLSGSFLIEMLFAIPGLGSEFIQSLSERDYTVICGLTLTYGLILIITNLFLDFSLRLSDPRLREPS